MKKIIVVILCALTFSNLFAVETDHQTIKTRGEKTYLVNEDGTVEFIGK